MTTKSFYALMVVLFVSLLFTSCQKEEIANQTQEVIENQASPDAVEQGIGEEDLKNFLPPKGFKEKSEEERKSFLDNMKDEGMEQMIENSRIASFLRSIGKYDVLYKKLENGKMFIDLDLTKELSSVEIRKMADYEEVVEGTSRRFYFWYCSFSDSCWGRRAVYWDSYLGLGVSGGCCY